MLVKLGHGFELYLYNTVTGRDLELFVSKVEKHFSVVTLPSAIYRKIKFRGTINIRLCMLN